MNDSLNSIYGARLKAAGNWQKAAGNKQLLLSLTSNG
jgi:hypothetical protein